MMLPSQYLEKGWTQNTFARDAYDMKVDEQSSEAVSWCMAGAVEVLYRNNIDKCNQIYEEIENITGVGVEEYNDAPNRTKNEVISCMKTVESNLKLA